MQQAQGTNGKLKMICKHCVVGATLVVALFRLACLSFAGGHKGRPFETGVLPILAQ